MFGRSLFFGRSAIIKFAPCFWHGRTMYSWGRLDLAVLFTPSTLNRQKSSALEHLCWRTPEYSVFRGGVDRTVTWPVPKKMADHCLHAWIYFLSLDLFRSTPSAHFYLFRWMFWRTPSTLNIAKSSPPLVFDMGVIMHVLHDFWEERNHKIILMVFDMNVIMYSWSLTGARW